MRPETKQLLKNLIAGAVVVFFLLGSLWGAWHVSRLPTLTIDRVLVQGGETLPLTQLQIEVETILEGSYWQFIPRRFVWLYPRAEIIAELSRVPRVKDVQVARDDTALLVTLSEHKPVALWCDAVGDTTTCVFLNDEGRGFAVAPDLSGGAFVRYVRTGRSAEVDTTYAEAADFEQLQNFVELLGQFGWVVHTVELDQARDAFVHLIGGGELKITLMQSLEDTLSNLVSVLTADEYEDFSPVDFAYIDLRFGDKVFVSELGPPSTTVVTSTATSTVETVESDAEVE